MQFTKGVSVLNLFNDKYDFQAQFSETSLEVLGKDLDACDKHELFYVLASLIANKSRRQEPEILRYSSSGKPHRKKVYCFSMEFLLGPLLDNYLLNFGCRDLIEQGLADMGHSLDELCSLEPDPGLGNGGLGRLIACFLDSMASNGIRGFGCGIRYRYGLFRQEIVNGCQVEKTDNWLAGGYPWETRKPASAVYVRFGGEVNYHEDADRFWFTWDGGELVQAVPYDISIVGYGANDVNRLRLFSAEPAEEGFDLDAFNRGEYDHAMKFRTDVEAISTVLYPNDAFEHGRILRFKQEYFFVSAGLQTILRTYKKEYGRNFEELPEHVAIHTNDTHPALVGPELMRLLVDEEGVGFEQAWDIAHRCISYTNHTIMPEALEKWPIEMVRSLVPRTYMFIEMIDARWRDSFPKDLPNWHDLLRETAILWDGQVRMANLSVIFSHSVNGVSALHTDILKREVLSAFHALEPSMFNNKTNGVSHRRFLANANPAYARLITDAIGDGWLSNADELGKLTDFEHDESFLDGFGKARHQAKERLARYVADTTGLVLDPTSVFDVQVKRFHAYKRQLLYLMKVMDLYNRMLDDPTFKPVPTTFILAGKAAASYTFAKEVVRLANSVADVINNDKRVNDYIKLAFIPNFAVSNAQLIYPAADISEQISTAGTEASGTSNMKLMFNGAITLGTYDGSNIEITKLVGEENLKIFGLRADEVEQLKSSGQHFAWELYSADKTRLGRVVDQLSDETFARLSGSHQFVHDALMLGNDPDFVMADFHAYVQAFDELTERYKADQKGWRTSAVHNTAMAGFFSSDRTIREYAEDIWKVSVKRA